MTHKSIYILSLIILIFVPTSVSAGITYFPGPTHNDTFEPGIEYSYTLPDTLNEKCSTVDCKYVTNLDDNIGYCMFGRGQEMLLSITITSGNASTYPINVSTWEFSPSEITITTGSTLVFTVIDNSTMHNIVLPWSTPIVEEPVETPGFGFNISTLAILFAFIYFKSKTQKYI